MPTGSNSLHPQQLRDVSLRDTVVQLSCGSFHSLLLTSAGEVFSWGSNGNGQLGHPQTPELVRLTYFLFNFLPYFLYSLSIDPAEEGALWFQRAKDCHHSSWRWVLVSGWWEGHTLDVGKNRQGTSKGWIGYYLYVCTSCLVQCQMCKMCSKF